MEALKNISIRENQEDDAEFTTNVKRNSKRKDLWNGFISSFRNGELTLTCIIDFPYKDYGFRHESLNLPPSESLLERMFVFKVGENTLERFSLHVHSLERWNDRGAINNRAKRVSAVNLRRCTRLREDELFEEAEFHKDEVLPFSPYLRENWRKHLREGQTGDIEWRWRDRPGALPKFDKSYPERYKEVRAVLEFASAAQSERDYYYETYG